MQKTSLGFALPTVIITSGALLVTSFAILQAVISIRTLSTTQYHIQLADEAAEAGVTYASACLENNNRKQTWGSNAYGGVAKPNLTQDTDCFGADYLPGLSVLVAEDNRIKTEFVVSNLDFVSENATQVNSVQITATGYAKVKTGATGSITKTYQASIKKTIVWNADYLAEKSASGTTRTCGILSGSVYCWGTNAWGQLGNGTDGGGDPSVNASTIPVKITRNTYPTGIGSKKVTSMVAGNYFNCALLDTAEVYCWGDNRIGQLGIGSTTPSISSVPVKVTGLSGKTITKLGVSSNTVCAITSIGDLYCWGKNNNGQVGTGNTTSPQSTPVLIAGPSKSSGGGDIGTKVVSDISPSGAFNDHVCAVAQGKAYCWGYNADGQLGINSTTQQTSPKAVNTTSGTSDLYNKTVVAIAGDGNDGDTHTCAMAYTTVITDAKAYCWGSNSVGQVGNAGSYGAGPRVPKAVSTSGVLSGKIVTEIGVNDIGGCAIAYPSAGTIDDSRAYCWGAANARGDGSSSKTNIPVAVLDANTPSIFGNNKVYGLIGGAQRFCALVKNKSYCWGVNGVGQIGDGTTDSPKRQPTEALFLRPKNNQYIY